jgi:diacylglycerol O-acyltransferase / wax synthase
MRRLRGIDAIFLYGETPRTTMHTLKVAILAPIEGKTPYSFDRVKESMSRRIHRVPPFRWLTVPTPLNIHHPVWVDDPNFDVDYHIRRMTAPAPGTMRQLCEVISDISSRPLDRSRPLWELYMVEGLENGRIASVLKIHHALADGVASAEMIEQYYDTEPLSDEQLGPPPAYKPEKIPGTLTLMKSAAVDVGKLLSAGIPRILQLRKETKARLEGRGAENLPPAPYSGPKVSFTRSISPHRIFACAGFSLDDVKQVRAAFGTTINDVVLAMVAGSLRRYLEKRDELPETPLVASIPVSKRSEEEKGTYGNVLGSMKISLRTDVADTLDRLRASHEAARISKGEFNDTWGARLENWVEFWPPPLVQVFGAVTRLAVKVGAPSEYALVMSNVPGPKQTLYSGNHRVEAFYSVGPVLEGAGLNMTVWSYVDQLNFGLLACKEVMPDLWELTDYLGVELEALKKAASVHGGPSGNGKSATASTAAVAQAEREEEAVSTSGAFAHQNVGAGVGG